MLAVADTGPLYAAVDTDDAFHGASVEALRTPGLRIVIPALVVAEVSYLISSRIGPEVEAAFLRGLEEVDVESPEPKEWGRIAELVERYGDFPLGATDASVVSLAERLDTEVVLTLDRRHFAAVRPRHCRTFTILPH